MAGNLPRNSICEVYITAKNKSKVIHLKFSELSLSSGDDVTIYDPSNDSLLAKYNHTGNQPVAFALKSHSVRVVFTSADSLATVGRGFVLIYQALSPGKRLTFITLPCLALFNFFLIMSFFLMQTHV